MPSIGLGHINKCLPTLRFTIIDDFLDLGMHILIGSMLQTEGVEGVDGGGRHFDDEGANDGSKDKG